MSTRRLLWRCAIIALCLLICIHVTATTQHNKINKPISPHTINHKLNSSGKGHDEKATQHHQQGNHDEHAQAPTTTTSKQEQKEEPSSSANIATTDTTQTSQVEAKSKPESETRAKSSEEEITKTASSSSDDTANKSLPSSSPPPPLPIPPPHQEHAITHPQKHRLLKHRQPKTKPEHTTRVVHNSAADKSHGTTHKATPTPTPTQILALTPDAKHKTGGVSTNEDKAKSSHSNGSTTAKQHQKDDKDKQHQIAPTATLVPTTTPVMQEEEPVHKLTKEEEAELLACSKMDGLNVFELGSRLHCKDNNAGMWILFVGAFAVCLVLEITFSLIERRIKRYRVMREIVSIIYRELTIIGLVAFGIFLLQSFAFQEWGAMLATVSKHAPGRLLIIDFVQTTLFVSALMFVMMAFITVFWIKRIRNKFSFYEHKKTVLVITQEYYQLKLELAKINLCKRLFCWRLLYKYSNACDAFNYHSMRQRFLSMNDLHKDFSFERYMKYQVEDFFINLIRVSIGVWFMAISAAFGLYVYSQSEFYDLYFKGGLWSFVLIFEGVCFSAIFFVYFISRMGLSMYINKISMDVDHVTLNEPTETGDSDNVKIGLLDSKFVPRINMRRYFLLHPVINFYILQFCFVLQAFYLGNLVTHYTSMVLSNNIIFSSETAAFKYGFLSIIYLIPFVSFGVIYPMIIPAHTILSSVENYANPTSIKKVNKYFARLDKIKKETLEEELVESDSEEVVDDMDANEERENLTRMRIFAQQMPKKVTDSHYN